MIEIYQDASCYCVLLRDIFFSFKGDVVHTKMATKYLSYDSLGRAYFPTYAYLLLSEPFPQAESDLWPTTFIFPSPFLQFEQIEKRQ